MSHYHGAARRIEVQIDTTLEQPRVIASCVCGKLLFLSFFLYIFFSVPTYRGRGSTNWKEDKKKQNELKKKGKKQGSRILKEKKKEERKERGKG